MKRKFSIHPYMVGLSIVFILAVCSFLPIAFIDQVELKLLDLRFRNSQRTPVFKDVVIVAIDKKSEEALGRWPWDRDKYAGLIDAISRGAPAVIGVDLVFSQPQKSGIPDRYPESEDVAPDKEKRFEVRDYDKIFADSVRNAGNVVLGYYFFTEDKSEVYKYPPEKVAEHKKLLDSSRVSSVRSVIRQGERFPVPTGAGVEMTIGKISGRAKAKGFLNVYQDSDGVLRRSTNVIRYDDDWYLSFPLQIFRLYTGVPGTAMRVDDYGISDFRVGEKHIPVSSDGSFLIDYTVRMDSFPTYSCVDVLNGRVPDGGFRNKVVLIGITDPGLIRDHWTTPTGLSMPGIKTHALAVTTMMEGRFIRYTDNVELLNLLFLILFGVTMTFSVIRFSRAIYGALLAVLLFAGYTALAFWSFRNIYIWLNMIYPLGCIIIVYITESLFYAIRSEIRTREIKNAFKSYVSPAVVEELIKNPDKLRLGGERKKVSVLFSDIKGFSTISETLAPEELANYLNRYFTPMTEIVFRRDGTLDKYIGDALLAFFGAPLPQDDHAFQATATAMDMVAALERLHSARKEESVPFHIGIGINTGEVSVGNMGSRMRFDYTVIGDNVNVAQRLEQATRKYRNSILISENTYLEVRDRILCREIDSTSVKGRIQQVKIYEPVGLTGDVAEETLKIVKLYEKGLALFREGRMNEALNVFLQVVALLPGDGPSSYFIEMCRKDGQSG